MKHSIDCVVYYSITGTPFNIFERKTDQNLWAASTHLEIEMKKLQLAVGSVPGNYSDVETETEAENEPITLLAIPREINGGPFFSSDTQCIIMNRRNQILRLNKTYRFGIKLYRNLNNPNLFTLFFKEREYRGAPQWVCI